VFQLICAQSITWAIFLSTDRPDVKRVVLAFVVLVCVMLGALAFPRSDFLLVAINPALKPGSMMEIIGKAGGTFVASTQYPWLAVAHSEAPGFAFRLFKSGALMVMDHALAAGCTEESRK
jgi:hypothetical protein